MTQLRSGRSHKLTEWDRRPRLQLSLPSSKLLLEATSAQQLCRELHEMGFHGRAAAHKPKITMRNAKRRLEWTLETRSLE